MSTIASHSPLNIWETVRVEAWFRRTPIGNGLGKSNNHVTDDVTWPPKGQVVAPIRLELNISITVGDAI